MKLRPVVLPVCSLLLGCFSVARLLAADPVFEEIGSLKTLFEPLGEQLINGGDGYFYGTARWAESAPGGCVYRVLPGRDTVEVLYSFGTIRKSGDTNVGGSNLTGPLVPGPDGAFYGTTGNGGGNARGTIFRLSVDGTFGVLKDVDSEFVSKGLIATPQGELYGVTNLGGPLEGGTVFKVDTNGIYKTVVAFSDNVMGAPNAPVEPGVRLHYHCPTGLALGTDGEIYGNCSKGGTVYRTQSGFNVSHGGMFRLNPPTSVTVVGDSDGLPRFPSIGVPTFNGFLHVDGLRHLVRTSFYGATTSIRNLTPLGGAPRVLLETSSGIYGVSNSGGNFGNGYIFHSLSGSGKIVHHFATGDASRKVTLAEGNDGYVYGIAAFPQGYQPSAETLASASIGGRAQKKAKPAVPRPLVFRFKADAEPANLVPAAKPDLAWLPTKSVNGKREVLINVLANDFDPDGGSLTVTGLGELSGGGIASIVTTPAGVRVRFETTEEAPASQVISYTLSDGQGGESTGSLSVKAPVTGSFSGVATSEGAADVPLTLTVGKNNLVTATLVLDGIKYTGKGSLDADDTADLSLTAKKQSALNLHLGLELDGSRKISAIFAVGEKIYSATCSPKVGRK